MAAVQPAQPVDGDRSRVWLYTPGYTGDLYSYPYPLTDCICRFGLAQPTASISPDRQYIVAGWPIAKGNSANLTIFRLADRTSVKVLDGGVNVALWGRTGHRLFVSGNGASWSWTPEGGLVALAGAGQWSYVAGLSPDGTQVAYTAYLDMANPTSLRVFVYDVNTDKTRMLRDALRSQVVFVKPGWVWYLEEASCDPTKPGCGPWGTAPSGRVQAMDLATGIEQQVDFLYAEDTTDLVSGEFWPNA